MSKILIIEDDPDLHNEIVDWLSFEGYQVFGALSGTDGVKLAKQELPDLILSDIMLPGINGFRVLLELRTNPTTALIPVIFMSALAERQNIRYGMDLGADDYLTKPFTNAELLSTIDTRLNKLSTARKQTQADMDSLRNTILRALPHELRTPLVGILGMAEILVLDANDLAPEQTKGIAQDILKSGRRLARLVENFILFTQLETASKGETIDRMTGPEKIIRKVCQRVEEGHDRKGESDVICSGAEIAISGEHFEKIAFELLDNALKFSPPGSHVGVNGSKSNGQFHLRITNQVTEYTLENFGEIAAFKQVDREVHEQQGTGLGLPIVKRLVELAGGNLEIESQGTEKVVVRVNLPLAGQKSS